MELIEIVALALAVIIIVKVLMLIAFPRHFRKFIADYFRKTGWHNYWSWICLVLFLTVAYVVFTAVPISHIVAALFLFSLYLHFAIFLAFPSDLRQLAEHAMKDPKRLWLAISTSLIIAVFTIYAILL